MEVFRLFFSVDMSSHCMMIFVSKTAPHVSENQILEACPLSTELMLMGCVSHTGILGLWLQKHSPSQRVQLEFYYHK